MYVPDNYDLYDAYEREQERTERIYRRLEIEEEASDMEMEVEEC